MYVPPEFRLEDSAAVEELLNRHDFGLLVTNGQEGPEATHLPFLYDKERGVIEAHLSRGNAQWRRLDALAQEGGQALLIVQGPHAYVSPRWYGTPASVPTWNYLAVHIYGRPRALTDRQSLYDQQRRLAARYENPADWTMDSVDPDVMERLLRGIYGFELPIERIEAKAKLSQNKSSRDRAGVIAALDGEERSDSRETALWMRRLTNLDA
ncbi:FMN-binding negative transcriptional regulator [Algihabitans sp.]|uniref:FMN-binding negative transcriptional regulator n=1 Tax=Algihabitans sp. TaxID=2821514 RepID=UPI003BA97BDA